MRRDRWTASEVAELRALFAEGATAAEAAAELGRTRLAVENKRRRLRLRGKPGDRPDLARRLFLADLLHKGLSLAAAARVMGTGSGNTCLMAQKLAREGVLVRTGTAAQNVRYRLSTAWLRESKGVYRDGGRAR